MAAAGNSDGFSIMSQGDMQAIIDRAIKASTADNITVIVTTSATGNTRFAANQLSTSGDISDTSVVVESAFGPKHATVSGNDLSDDGIRAMVAKSESLAKLAPDDPESMPPLGAQQYTSVPAWFDSTAALTAGDRAKAALTALQPARKAGNVTAAGFITTGAQATLAGNKAGLAAYFRSTSANYTLTVRTADGTGSGWAGADNKDWSAIDFAAVADRALHKAQLARNPVVLQILGSAQISAGQFRANHETPGFVLILRFPSSSLVTVVLLISTVELQQLVFVLGKMAGLRSQALLDRTPEGTTFGLDFLDVL